MKDAPVFNVLKGFTYIFFDIIYRWRSDMKVFVHFEFVFVNWEKRGIWMHLFTYGWPILLASFVEEVSLLCCMLLCWKLVVIFVWVCLWDLNHITFIQESVFIIHTVLLYNTVLITIILDYKAGDEKPLFFYLSKIDFCYLKGFIIPNNSWHFVHVSRKWHRYFYRELSQGVYGDF